MQKRDTGPQIAVKVRPAEVLERPGKSIPEACKQIHASEHPYGCRRLDYNHDRPAGSL